MNWKIHGKRADGSAGSLTIIGKATEVAARESVEGTHPGFTIEKVVQLDGALKPIHTAAAVRSADKQ